MADYRPVNVRPADGGKLITKASQNEAGLFNYVIKRDWRRRLDQEMRREGYDYFQGNYADILADQPFPNGLTEEEITLVHLSRRPNGQNAIIVGTKDKLWRFLSEDGFYVDPGYVDDGYVLAYTGNWILIGSGFSTAAHRWEAYNLNGTTIFNNGVDLPVAYRVEWVEVRPVYELRESGIASVGTITEHSGIGMAADIRLMADDTLAENMALVDSMHVSASQVGATYSGLITATVGIGSQTVTASGAIFAIGDIGKTIRFANGFETVITGFTGPTIVLTADPAPEAITNVVFWLTTAAGGADFVVVASAPIFVIGDVGRQLLWDSGEVRTITGFTNSTTVTVDYDLPIASGFFKLENQTSYGQITTNIDRIQYRIMWSLPDDPERYGPAVPGSIAAGSQMLTLAYPLASLQAGQEIVVIGAGPDGGNLIAEILYIDGIGTKLLLDEAAETTVVGSTTDGTFSFQITASANGTLVTASGEIFAATDVGRVIRFGSGFSATITDFISATEIEIAEPTTVVNESFWLSSPGYVTRADTLGSILGYEDLQDDGSGILRMLTLDQTLVIYKDTSIFLGAYTANVDAPFLFTRLKIPSDKTLYYRWTLVDIEGDFHLYAAKDSFFRFDLTTRIPQQVDLMEWVGDLFFPTAKIAITDQLWATVNTLTNEAWFRLPPGQTDKFICLDYRYKTQSTTTIDVTAAATVKRPTIELQTAETEDWFVMGTADSTVLTYGLANAEQSVWSNKRSIFYRRGSNPYDGTTQPYESRLKSGLTDFGAPNNEKDASQLVVHLASQQTPFGQFTVTVNIYTTINAAETPVLEGTMDIASPFTDNMVPFYFRGHFFQHELVVNGQNNPVHLSQTTWMAAGVITHGIVRRPKP